MSQVLLDELDLRDLRNAALPQAWAGLTGLSGGDKNSGRKAAGGTGSKPSSGAGGSEAGAAGGSEKQSKASETSASSASQQQSRAVRVATIDNYQGEEADVVVVSLVRSNKEGHVGFLREPERINVMLSRARHGLLMVGNSETLQSARNPAAKKHWGQVLDALHARGCMFPGFPAVCQRHGTTPPAALDSGTAFRQHAPDGGCCLPCNAVLPCGHACVLRCHAYDPDHQSIKCQEQVYSYCDKGHLTIRLCSEPEAACTTCVDIKRIQDLERAKLKELVSAK